MEKVYTTVEVTGLGCEEYIIETISNESGEPMVKDGDRRKLKGKGNAIKYATKKANEYHAAGHDVNVDWEDN